MAEATDKASIAAGSARRILYLLEALTKTEAGTVIYQQVERVLSQLVAAQSNLEQVYAGITLSLLDACARHLPANSSSLLHLRLLQARLRPPLDLAELSALQHYVDQQAVNILQRDQQLVGVLDEALAPLYEAFGISDATPASPQGPAAGEPEAGNFTQRPVTTPARILRDEAEPLPDFTEASGGDVEQGVMQNHIRDLQAGLASQVLDTISQNQEFGVLLEVVHQELKTADTQQLDDLRGTLVREIERLRAGHQDLAGKLDQTYQHLQTLESDSRQLSDELTRVRLLSLTDELTGLSNRRAFLRRLEDEVARVQRYGFPLSIALIDLDHFKAINDEYGHAAGDEVLRVYAQHILSVFRHHDLVARYGGEEFAVLLPNTDMEGSSRALHKVRQRCYESKWEFYDQTLPVPTFSAGLALYKPGETSSAFIERVDKALYRAKRLGRDRIEMDLSYQINSVEDDADQSGAD